MSTDAAGLDGRGEVGYSDALASVLPVGSEDVRDQPKKRKMGGAERLRLKKLAENGNASPLTGADDAAPPPYEYREHALIVAPGLSWEAWTSIWATVDRIHKSSSFYVGDALLAGQREFGERFSQVVDVKYLEPQRGAMWVCSKIEPSRRREDLSFSFHRELAAMDPEEQDRWIREAEPRCTVARLKELMATAKRRANGGPPVTEQPPPLEPDPFLVEQTDTFGDAQDVTGEPLQRREAPEASEIPPTPLRPSPGDAADEIRALIEAVRRLAPSLSPDWRTESTIRAPDTRGYTVRFAKGNQIAVGEGPSLPAALVDAALAAMISDLEVTG